MPTYEYQCKSCNHTFERVLSISNRKIPTTEPCPSCSNISVDQAFLTAPPLGDPVRLGFIKPDNGFKEVLQKINEKTAGSRLKESSNISSI